MVWVCWKNPILDQTTEPRPFSEAALTQKTKFHTNYTGQAKPRCFCNCLRSPAQKRKEKKKLGLDDDEEE